jgi:hypothetical protein
VKDYRCVTTRAVRDELEHGVARYPQLTATRRLDWLTEVAVDGLAELGALAAYLQLLSRDQRHFGEATVLAWADWFPCDGETVLKWAREHGLL